MAVQATRRMVLLLVTTLVVVAMMTVAVMAATPAFAQPGGARIAVARRIPKSGISHQPQTTRTSQDNSRTAGSGTTPTLVAVLQVKRIKLVGSASQKAATSFT